MPTKLGAHTLRLDSTPSVLSFAAVASKKEGEGPLGNKFDILNDDTSFGQQSWEKAESQMQKLCVNKALEKANLSPDAIDYMFAGDLLNQCIGSHYGLRDLSIPFLGLYGACSTMAESLALSSMFVDSGLANQCVAVTSSHFCSAERQFRFPLEYGGQRTPTAQWTVTGSGSVVVGKNVKPPYVKAVCIGTIEDLGIKDVNNMGAAMAPAAAKTIQTFFEDTCTNADNYDLILTGDLGEVGSDLLSQLLAREGISLGTKHNDCGLIIYDRENQKDINAGGSGCGCSATVLCADVLPKLQDGTLKDVLFIATGALMSPTSVQQGESIPGIAHLVYLSSLPGQKGVL
ncbi:stage V sporulation protein AD [Hydrogenoanaerobacterium sp.]|uniref:stage V sporulation protein AD n=1 Tax=Hydrogenoanaerobacterium sp. TaxID=2953763 RepID=UPI0028984EE6|nr:stage V sporulation protein AD [Hydrogenoanaerobacterium sp.]